MKVTADSGPAPLVGGVTESVSMGISDDPEDQLMILNVLSNTLYSDKVAAVLREYGCNGADANTEAGRGDTPIEVRLPNKLDPTLAIRDFGHGMTGEQILQVFCRLGRSTKRNSNAFTGMLGIGSKAGFAYGDSFLVTSFAEGTKSVYNCYRDRGAPRMSKMHEEPSNSPDGIEIKVPIRINDFAEFVTKAERIFRYFKVQPIIQGAKIEWQARGVAEFEGTGWRYTGSGTSVAIMGNVGYTLSPAALPLGIPTQLRTLIDLGVELDFEIGDLEIAANREGLQYKDHTIKSITDRLSIVAKEVAKVFTDRISKAPTLWDAHRMYGDNFEKLGKHQYGVRTLKEVVTGAITWQGKKITTGRFTLKNVEKLPGIHVVEFTKNNYKTGSYSKMENPSQVYASEKTVLVLNDLPSATNSPSRVKGFFETDTKGVERLVTFTFANVVVQSKYWKARGLDNAPTINLSSIAPSVHVQVGSAGSSGPSIHRAKHSAKVFTLAVKVPDDSWTRSKWWDNAEVDLENDSGVYVKIDKFFAMRKDIGGIWVPDDPQSFYNNVQSLVRGGLLKNPIYGFKPPMIAKLGKGWVPLDVDIKMKYDKWIKANQQDIADADAAGAHTRWMPAEEASKFPKGSAMHTYLKAYSDMLNNGRKAAAIVSDIRKRSNNLLPSALPKLPDPTHDLKKLSAEVFATYPMFPIMNRFMTHYWSDKNLLPAVVEYVTLIGK